MTVSANSTLTRRRLGRLLSVRLQVEVFLPRGPFPERPASGRSPSTWMPNLPRSAGGRLSLLGLSLPLTMTRSLPTPSPWPVRRRRSSLRTT
ncbi:unnamed protein product [Prunus armeniaca]